MSLINGIPPDHEVLDVVTIEGGEDPLDVERWPTARRISGPAVDVPLDLLTDLSAHSSPCWRPRTAPAR